MSEKRNFALREKGKETAIFSGRQPRQAALKAA
ncbi:MAG: chromosomal protein MC1, partial [Candidatus Diapherotrites archaeon]|nr:chromosomal protein MC1 [Candidatus Diapherotrites archaeon]